MNIGKNNDNQGNRLAVCLKYNSDNNTNNDNYGCMYLQGEITRYYNNKVEVNKKLETTQTTPNNAFGDNMKKMLTPVNVSCRFGLYISFKPGESK